jgi:UPF0755 protein
MRIRWARVFLFLAVAGLLVAGGIGFWWQRQVDPPGQPGEEVSIAIPPGTSTQRIAAILDDRGIISNARLFRVYLRLNGGGPFEAGQYTFRENQAFGDVVAELEGGGEIRYDRLTIPEGFTIKKIAERVGRLPGRSADRFLELAESGTVRSRYQKPGSNNLEGLLFPETYSIEEKDDERAILERMVRQFEDVASDVGLDRAARNVGLSPYEALVVASLVESEGKVAEDRPKIARVIYNRLEKGMLLQIDATVIYARGGERREGGRVLFSDLEVDSPYNTYKNKGLPPTPISAMGRTALEAALQPEPGPWLFYVKYQKDGTHKFATTLAEHNRNIADAKRRGVNP